MRTLEVVPWPVPSAAMLALSLLLVALPAPAAPPGTTPPPDGTPPAVTPVSPLAGQVVAADVTIRMDYADGGSGIDPASAELVLDGADRTVDATVTTMFIALVPPLNDDGTPEGLPPGSHEVTVTVRDRAGNAGTATVAFTVASPPSDLPPDPTTVAPPVDPTVATDIASATAFLYSGEDPIQTGVAPGAIEARRVAVLRGRVLSRDGSPLPGVAVTLPEHPALGSTLSRADGHYDLAVNGGGALTLDYAVPDHLPARRTVQVPWRDFVWVEDVVLVPFDPVVTEVVMGAAEVQVARGSVVEDDHGSRRATLVFQAGTTAAQVFEDGQQEDLPVLHVRATEYTVGETGAAAMPAPLPPASGYTYAVELSADEAPGGEVVFSRPVVLYLENFLDFPVGGIAPVGTYDRERAAWAASENGLVVRVLGATGDLAELDLTGAGAPADAAALVALGETEGERRELARLYSAGQSLWRVPLAHFTPVDINWPFGPPADAEEPPELDAEEPAEHEPEDPEEAEEDDDRPGEDEPDPCEQQGSVLECENQTLGKDLPLAGTPFSLHYRSDRVPGRSVARSLRVRLSGPSIPASLQRVDLTIDVAGQRFARTFPPQPNLAFTSTWDGRDAYGRALQGKQPATARVTYVYPGQYYPPAPFPFSFARFSGALGSTIGTSGRAEATLSRSFRKLLGGAYDATAQGLGGWTLDAHHVYDPTAQVVVLGDGRRQTGGRAHGVVYERVTSSGVELRRLAAAPDGSLFALRRTGSFPDIVRFRPDGTSQTVFSQFGVNRPIQAIAADDQGEVYFTFAGCGSVQPAELRRTNADTGAGGSDLVLGPGAFQCALDLARGPEGSLYVAESGRILRLDPTGSLSTFASTATVPDLNPEAIAVAGDGMVYVLEGNQHRVRAILPTGEVRAVAGTGTAGFAGDGGDARLAQLSFPSALALAPDGALLVLDLGNQRSRRVTPSGTISTVAGNGQSGAPRAGAPALAAPLGASFLNDLAAGPDGRVHFTSGSTLWRTTNALPGFGLGDILVASEDGQAVFVFDSAGRHRETRDALTGGLVHRFTHDASGLLVRIEDPHGNATTIERGLAGDTLAVVGPFGQRTVLETTAAGYLETVTGPDGAVHRFTYDVGGLLRTETDPNGNVSRYTYSAAGRLTRAEDAAGGSKVLARAAVAGAYRVALATALGRRTTYTWQSFPTGERLQIVTAPNGLATVVNEAPDGTSVTHHPDGTVVRVAEAPDPRFSMQAPAAGSVEVALPSGLIYRRTTTRTATVLDPQDPLSLQALQETVTVNGRTATRTFDAVQRRMTRTSPTGRPSVTSVDAFRRPVSIEVPGVAPVGFSYDSRGRLSAITQGTGEEQRTVGLTYSPEGWLSALTDPLLRTVSFERDAAGRVRRQTLPDGRVIEFSYDANGNLTSLTPPGRPSHGFGFTPVDLPDRYAPPPLPPEPSETSYTYNPDQQLTSAARPDGRSLALSHDSGGRLAAIDFSHGPIGYGYDPASGVVASLGAPEVALRYAYDGELLTGTTWSGAVAGSVSRAYDHDFRLTSQRVNGANEVTFQYDADSLLMQAGAMTLARDGSNGLLTGTTLGQVTTSQSYNAFGELASLAASIGGAAIYTVDFTRDKLGRITERTETIGSVTTRYGYGYDLVGRLTDVTLDGAVLAHYDYDPNGNRTAQTTPTGQVTASYDSQDRLLAYGDLTYTYTAAGELTTKTQGGSSISFEYDELGSLRRAVLPTGITIDYVIDGRNRRVGKRVNGALVQGFLYENRLNPVAELDGTGNVVARFVYGSRLNVPDYILKAGATYRIVADHLGSARLIVDTATGAVAQRMDFDEFGRVVLDTNPGFQPFGFAGGLYDRHTGLIRFGARDYDPQVGRWTAKDPLGFGADGPNLYGYVLNDPVNLIDPSGLVNIVGGVGASGVVITGVEASAGVIVNPGVGDAKPAGGVFGSVGACGGFNLSADAFVGVVKGKKSNVSGETINFNLSVGPVSLSLFFDASGKELVGGTLGVGPSATPLGASLSLALTGVATIGGD